MDSGNWVDRLGASTAALRKAVFDGARDASCELCNTDTHRCPGCGEPLPHGMTECDACRQEAMESHFGRND